MNCGKFVELPEREEQDEQCKKKLFKSDENLRRYEHFYTPKMPFLGRYECSPENSWILTAKYVYTKVFESQKILVSK